ncbi:Protein of unknown function DUF3846 [uncultured Caudovirales phage]|uniref:DUF3846 domain-containing protein n=1 Tax=uncultured Caudovirales phage TaxID=2100421 RepID=A0A6J5L4P7_9CAUD|nr:Protein of unknown function DUF3846 [uncultured Caudovirales phage]
MFQHKAVIIHTNGSKSVVEFNEETEYDVLSGAVGGYIERVTMRNEVDMWVNEEGKLNGLPQNPIATAIWQDSYGNTDVIVGDVIFTCDSDTEGNILGLSEAQIEELLAYNSRLWTMESFVRDSFA